jgi:hypothetical protein
MSIYYGNPCLAAYRRQTSPRSIEAQRLDRQRWNALNRTKRNEMTRASYQRRMADPEKRAAYNARMRETSRKRWAKMMADPEKHAAYKAKKRAYDRKKRDEERSNSRS